MAKWKIYYGDGTTFTDADGEPGDAPPLNVQAVVCEPWCWREGDWFGLMDYLMQPGVKVVKFGRTIDNETFRRIFEEASRDPYFNRNTRVVNTHGHFYWYVGEA